MISSTVFTKITIITPSFNQGKFLEETILSVLNQKYSNLEYIIFDGGSSDNSVEIIKKYKKQLAYWESQKDRGQSHAINKGLRIATGDIIGWLNSDDTYLPGTFNIIVRMFQRYPEFDAIYGNQVLTDTEGRFLRIKHELPYSYHRLMYNMYQSQPATFLRRSVIDQIGFLNEDLHYSMDYEYFLRLGKRCKVKHVPYLFAKYRLHANSKSATYGQDKHMTEINTVVSNFRPNYSNIKLLDDLIHGLFELLYSGTRILLVLLDNPLGFFKYLHFKKY